MGGKRPVVPVDPGSRLVLEAIPGVRQQSFSSKRGAHGGGDGEVGHRHRLIGILEIPERVGEVQHACRCARAAPDVDLDFGDADVAICRAVQHQELVSPEGLHASGKNYLCGYGNHSVGGPITHLKYTTVSVLAQSKGWVYHKSPPWVVGKSRSR